MYAWGEDEEKQEEEEGGGSWSRDRHGELAHQRKTDW